MLEDLVACGAAVEVSDRGSHRLYGLPGTEGIRGETTGPRPWAGTSFPCSRILCSKIPESRNPAPILDGDGVSG
jgi:hypothetical protein